MDVFEGWWGCRRGFVEGSIGGVAEEVRRSRGWAGERRPVFRKPVGRSVFDTDIRILEMIPLWVVLKLWND